MASAREMRMRIRSVKNISQVTHALEAVSASKVRKAMAAVQATRPYATKAWQVLTHVAGQPGRENLHPLLTRRAEIKKILVVVISGDRGLAGHTTPTSSAIPPSTFDRHTATGQLYRRWARKGVTCSSAGASRWWRSSATCRQPPPLQMFPPSGAWQWMNFLKGEVDEV